MEVCVQDRPGFIATAVCIVLAAGSEIQANLQFNIFSFSPFVPFTGGALRVQIWLPPKSGDNGQACAIIFTLGFPEIAAL